jgi:hypothetical protein
MRYLWRTHSKPATPMSVLWASDIQADLRTFLGSGRWGRRELARLYLVEHGGRNSRCARRHRRLRDGSAAGPFYQAERHKPFCQQLMSASSTVARLLAVREDLMDCRFPSNRSVHLGRPGFLAAAAFDALPSARVERMTSDRGSKAGRTHQTFSKLLAPARISARNSRSNAAAFRLRAMLSLVGFCLSRDKAIFRSRAKFAAPRRC